MSKLQTPSVLSVENQADKWVGREAMWTIRSISFPDRLHLALQASLRPHLAQMLMLVLIGPSLTVAHSKGAHHFRVLLVLVLHAASLFLLAAPLFLVQAQMRPSQLSISTVTTSVLSQASSTFLLVHLSKVLLALI